MVWLLLASLGLAASSALFMRRRSGHLPDVPDEDFLRIFKKKFDGRDSVVIEERNTVAGHIALPARKLSPEQKFSDLAKYAGFVGEYEVGMGDLEDRLIELCRRASMGNPNPFPATVGEYIQEVAKAKERLAGDKL